MHMVGLMQRLMLVSLDDGVVFPGMPITLSFDPGSEKQVLLVPRHGGRYAKVGVVAEVTERVQLPGRGVAVSLLGCTGQSRAPRKRTAMAACEWTSRIVLM